MGRDWLTAGTVVVCLFAVGGCGGSSNTSATTTSRAPSEREQHVGEFSKKVDAICARAHRQVRALSSPTDNAEMRRWAAKNRSINRQTFDEFDALAVPDSEAVRLATLRRALAAYYNGQQVYIKLLLSESDTADTLAVNRGHQIDVASAAARLGAASCAVE